MTSATGGRLQPIGRTRMPVIAVFVMTLCGTSAFAQGIGKGIRAGVNVTTTKTSSDSGDAAADWQVRGVLGGFITWRVASWLELQPEVLYAMKGAKTEEFGLTAKLLLDYVEVPVLARASRRSASATSWYVVGGPSFGVRARAKARTDFGDSTEEIDLTEDVERFDFGMAVGGGVEFGSVVVDGRYTHGLTDIDKDTSDEVKVTNRAVSLTVGFKF